MTGVCEMCKTDTELFETFAAEYGWPSRRAMLCKVCRNTWAGDAFFHPHQQGHAEILKSISSATNMILSELIEIRKKS